MIYTQFFMPQAIKMGMNHVDQKNTRVHVKNVLVCQNSW